MISWKKLPQLSLLILTGCAPLAAQSHSHGYFLVAPAVVSSDGENHAGLQAAVGGEGVFPGGIGLGAELGALGIRENSDTLVGMASVNGYFHVPRAFSSIDPFLTAGYTALVEITNGSSYVNFGGGMNWWFAPRLGLKLEFRDHVRSGNDSANIATFRFGLAFH